MIRSLSSGDAAYSRIALTAHEQPFESDYGGNKESYGVSGSEDPGNRFMGWIQKTLRNGGIAHTSISTICMSFLSANSEKS